MPSQAEKPRLEYPPLRLYWVSHEAYASGIREHLLEDILVRMYDPAKTVADCFKFRHRIGQDVALEALKECPDQKRCAIDDLIHSARIDRVERIMRPYLEALT